MGEDWWWGLATGLWFGFIVQCIVLVAMLIGRRRD